MEEVSNKQTPVHKKRSAAWRLTIKIFFFTSPFWLITALYFHDDPFMVMRNYRIYDSKVMLNEAYVGWHIYLNNRDSIPFNSFLMGNSCTMAFRCTEWEKYLNGGRAVRLFGNIESMMAIYKKLMALEREHAPIKNVLMILDKSSLSKTYLQSGYNFVLPPAISGDRPLNAQLAFLQGFVSPDFLFPYLKYRLTGTVTSSMKAFNPYGRIRNPINNDAMNPREKMIEKEGVQYWADHKKDFPYRDGKQVINSSVIFGQQQALLLDIEKVLRRNSTSVKIVISPDYKQEKINPRDVRILKSIFGKDNVFDFTGINEYTNDIHNFYEKGHYRPLLGNKLLKVIYQTPSAR